jgi:hypothetical protein
MRRTGVLAAAVLAACLAMPAAPASAGRAPAPPTVLAGRTTLVAATRSTRLAVRLPKAVTFPKGYTDVTFVAVSGTADTALAYLVPRTRPLLVEPASFGRMPGSVGHTTVAGFPSGKSSLAAGVYDLVLVHTPGTATITVTFPGLPGRTTLKPTAPWGAALKPLAVAPVTGTTYAPAGTTGGASNPLSGNGFVEVAGIMRSSGTGVTRVVSCLKPPGTPTPAPLDFAPECPGLDTVASVLLAGGFRYFATTFLNHDAGTYGAGFAYEGAIVPTAVAGYAAWVPLP